MAIPPVTYSFGFLRMYLRYANFLQKGPATSELGGEHVPVRMHGHRVLSHSALHSDPLVLC